MFVRNRNEAGEVEVPSDFTVTFPRTRVLCRSLSCFSGSGLCTALLLLRVRNKKLCGLCHADCKPSPCLLWRQMLNLGRQGGGGGLPTLSRSVLPGRQSAAALSRAR